MSQTRRLSLALGIALGVVVVVVWWRVDGESARNRTRSTREQDIEAEDRADEGPGTGPSTRPIQKPAPQGLPSKKRLTTEPRSVGDRDFIVHVVDADGPVESVHVMVAHSGGSAHEWTDSRGQARVVIQGNVEEVHVLQQLTQEQMQYLSPPPRRNLGMATEARFVLARAALIEGRVLLGDGEPLTLARIDLRSTDHELRMILRSDREGKFRVRVPVDATVDLEVTGRWQDRNGRLGRVDDGYEGSVAGVQAGSRDVILRAQRSARDRTVLVKTVDPEGAPIAQAKIFSASLRASPKTDESGYVRLDGLPGHRIRLRAAFAAEDTDLVAPEAIEVTPRGQEVVFRFVTGVRVAGVVANPDGSPAAGKVLKIRHKTGRATVTTDAAGRFRAYVYPSGEPVQVSVFDDDGKKLLAEVEALPGNDSLSIQLQGR